MNRRNALESNALLGRQSQFAGAPGDTSVDQVSDEIGGECAAAPDVGGTNAQLALVRPVDAEVDIEVMKAIPKSFAVEDEKSANWLVRKVVAARQYAQKVKEWSEIEQRRAEREEASLMFLFGRQLERWCKGEIDKLAGRRKSINLPSGTVGFRHIGCSLQVDDERAVLDWAASECPDAVTTVTKLSRSTLVANFKETGLVPPHGVHLEPETDKFYVR